MSDTTNPRPRYYIEMGRYGQDWEREQIRWNDPEKFYDLNAHIERANGMELHQGKYAVRVVDETGKVHAYITESYPIRINSLDVDLDKIRASCNLDKAVFAAACQRWLSQNRESGAL